VGELLNLIFFGSMLGENIFTTGFIFSIGCCSFGGGSSSSELRNDTMFGIFGSSCNVLFGVTSTLM